MAANGNDYGNYVLQSAERISRPNMTSRGLRSDGAPPGESAERSARFATVRSRLSSRFRAYGRPATVTPAPAPGTPTLPPPPIASVGVMDVGQGGCNMLIDRNTEPVAYFDMGFPLWQYWSGAPDNLQPKNETAWEGPITQNQAGTLEVVLSHWDFDHWYLGYLADLVDLAWIVPAQDIGGSALKFIDTIANVAVHNPQVPVTEHPKGYYRRLQCYPRTIANAYNNSGLALHVPMNLPATDANVHYVYLTGDANFISLMIYPFFGPVTGIAAVHHGSDANGAADDLPQPDAAYAKLGLIAYSYGISATSLKYTYGFPVPAAIAKYVVAGWTVARSTAEGANIRTQDTKGRGNIRMGDQTSLPDFYADTAFYNFPNKLE
jgi:hypothetical protein